MYQLNSFEKQQLDSASVHTLYIRFFDVDWDPLTRQPLPKAQVIFKEKPAYTIIPTIFITNECLVQTDTLQVQTLAANIVKLLNGMVSTNALPPMKELQIDCDWSGSTKNKYFELLKAIRQLSKLNLSATIRLYQVKYKERAGVPPVDRGLLMCYNMGNLKEAGGNNSIIDPAEFKKYSGKLGSYELPLDVALPIFNWKVWFRDNAYHGITEEFPDSLLNDKLFTRSKNIYTIQVDTILGGYSFKKGDWLRYEQSDPADVLKIAAEVSGKLKNTDSRVALYHLDSVLLKKYSVYEMERFYNSLR